MMEEGPARRYLHDVCPAAGFKLCGVLDTVPRRSSQFFASLVNDTLPGLGGLDGMREEAHEVVAGTIRSRPWDVFDAATRNIGRSFLVHAPGAELNPYTDWWMVDLLAQKFGPGVVRAYKASLQGRDAIPKALLRAIDNITFPVAVLALLTAGLYGMRQHSLDAISLGIFAVVALAINNVVCSLGSGMVNRLMARVTWLLPLCAILMIARLLRIDDARPSGALGAIEEASQPNTRQIANSRKIQKACRCPVRRQHHWDGMDILRINRT